MRTRLLLSVVAIAALGACASQGPMMAPYSQANLPDAVKAPAGHSVIMETAAAGDITYQCRPKKDMADQFEWVFVGPAASLKDRMVQNMGFERLETAALIVPMQSNLPLVGGSGGGGGAGGGAGSAQALPAPVMPDAHIELPQVPDTQHWPDEVKQAVRIVQTTQGATAMVSGGASADVLAQAETFISQAMPPKLREKVKEQFDEHRAVRRALSAPERLGGSFAPVPQLCLDFGGHIEVVERETLSDLGDWNLLELPVQLEAFAIVETVNSFEIDVSGERVKYRHIDAQQLQLNEVQSHISEQDLIRWLDSEVRQADISQPAMQAYLVKLMRHLTADKAYTLTALVRARFQLAQAIGCEIDRLRCIAMARGFQLRLSDMAVPAPQQMAHHSFQFEPGQYPARHCYRGSYDFNKHFYVEVHDLREKTPAGDTTEEFRCAQAIDSHAKVKQWVRNIERQPKFSFWLPTATDYFYPDFVAELADGRLLAVEYKGEPYKTNDDSREKNQVGHQWEQSSGGRCLFLLAVKSDDAGRDVFQQLGYKLA